MAKHKSKMIDKMLRNEELKIKKRIVLLLLGAGDSGKSTVLKQLQILHGQGFSPKERQDYLLSIRNRFLGLAKSQLQPQDLDKLDAKLLISCSSITRDNQDAYTKDENPGFVHALVSVLRPKAQALHFE
ncbi:G-protein alpha subunit-domain-containing protein [Gorgonomyces haynaldii]|nr:G-protein alpha subunit-domain-containing protein [Gorgonomyces haynaldii]